MALALYRKYRPKKLSELLGQEPNVEILKNAAKQNRIGHAYLFYGSRGTGKTTTARLIAKLLNCEKRNTDEAFQKNGEPCNECRSCREIDTNTSFDVIEIDAASNRGIDEIRNIKEELKMAPTGGGVKVYIIDEAHMLTPAAWNALLKTLEEPPRHAVFILATTEYEKIPGTITSRTQRFLFKKAAKKTILEKLRSMAKTENIPIDEPALLLIAAAAEGSFRDAESLLDQLHSRGTKINLETAERIIGRVGLTHVHALAEYILTDNLSKALGYLETIREEGLNPIQLTKDLIHYLRKVITLKANPDLEASFAEEFTDEEMKGVEKLAEHVTSAKHIPLLQALIRAYSEMRYSPFQTIPLEIALMEQLGSNRE